MSLRLPTIAELKELGKTIGLSLDEDEARTYAALLAGLGGGAFSALDTMPDDLPPVRYARSGGQRPSAAENPLNAWVYRISVKGAAQGKLAGRTVALKDNIMLAGAPLTNGSPTLDGYVAEIDATIVSRILDAGGEITGKANCECLCFSAGSHTSFTGPVHNPHRHGYSAGGSSSGSAALVGAGAVDMAIGCDQGGSIRIPASFCGVCGMKPTHGLVPYTGILPMDPTLDHVGPITRSVRDNALLLEVIAGADGLDPRQGSPVVHPYTSLLEGGVGGMRIALVREGFSQPGAEEDVNDQVRAAGEHLRKMGAAVEDVSIPMHRLAGAITAPIIVQGFTSQMDLDGQGIGRADVYVTSAMDFQRRWRARASELPETIKTVLLLGTYVQRQHGFHYYGKAMNLARRLTAAYDAVLSTHDLLLMPTAPLKPTPLPAPSASREEIIARAFQPSPNTGAFNLTHHPAMSVPCGTGDGLPIGMMLVAKHYDEPAIYRAAYAFEQSRE